MRPPRMAAACKPIQTGNPTPHFAAMLPQSNFQAGQMPSGVGVVVEPAAGDAPLAGRSLLVRFGAMGDMVLILPLLQALADHSGLPVDILSNGSWIRPLLAGQAGVGRIHLLDNRELPIWLSRPKQVLIRALQAHPPSDVWHCDADERLLGLLSRAGIGSGRIRRASQLPMAEGEHLIDYWQRFAELAGVYRPPSDPHWMVGSEARADLGTWLASKGLADRPLILIQPGNKRTMRAGYRRRPSNTKWWPETRWAEVLRALRARHPEAGLILLGVPAEAGLNDEILALAGLADGGPSPAAAPAAAGAAVINAARELPIARLIALQSVACGMVSVDTGPAHTAAAVGCPVVVLFGVADPVRIRPRSDQTPVEVVTGSIDGAPSMRGILVETVLSAWDRLPLRMPGRSPDRMVPSGVLPGSVLSAGLSIQGLPTQ